MTTEQQKECPHLDFAANVVVNRMQDSGAFTADITIKCAECALPFRFIGVPRGFSYKDPKASVNLQELRAPIEPDVLESIRRLAPPGSVEGFTITGIDPARGAS